MEFIADNSRAPEMARIKSKMIYAGTKYYAKTQMPGISFEIAGTDRSEVDFEVVHCKLTSMRH